MANKTVILGVTGGIAAYKSCEIVSRLRKLGYSVRVIMTQAATEFVTPLTFETLSNYRVITDMFDKGRGYDVEHISYAKLADVFLVAPATANFIAKLASGVADDMLTSTILATTAPIVVCPAMNTKMYENAQTAANIDALKKRGVIFIEPDSGMLACGDVGKGRMSEPKDIVEFVDGLLTPKPDFRG
ncbi:MAG: bifunctional phosphopantothenoylcysteine decarboxylase/phosphopantothenate--cysteine ligase CoaBC, partial [Clostridia bacterium]